MHSTLITNKCPWAENKPDFYRHYHDVEWGKPSFNDAHLFEHLVLEIAQAGVSWYVVLKKREGYARAFGGPSPEVAAHLNAAEIEQLLLDPGIIRNRAKMLATVHNARLVMELQQKHGSFANYMWGFVDGKQIDNKFEQMGQVPAETDLSRRISKEMKLLGFKFTGPVGIYAFMQSVGMVNDHLVSCPCR